VSRLQFGLYMRKLRIKNGLTQGQVASTFHYKTAQLVSNWERGTCYPPLADLQGLAKLYQVNLKQLFNRYCSHMKEDYWKKISSDNDRPRPQS